MFSIFKNLFKLIPSSTKDAAGRVSSARIQSYALLILIWLCVITFLGMEVVRASKSGNWEISDTMEQVFFALLAHHVAMLGVTKNAKAEPRGDLFKNLGEETIEETEVQTAKTETTTKTTTTKPNEPEAPKEPQAPKDPGKVGGKDIEDLI